MSSLKSNLKSYPQLQPWQQILAQFQYYSSCSLFIIKAPRIYIEYEENLSEWKHFPVETLTFLCFDKPNKKSVCGS